MVTENELLIEEVVNTIRKFVRTIYNDTYQMNRKYGLTGPQSSVLRTLVKHGPLSSAALSRRLYVTPSNITGIIDRLEKKELVQRIKKVGDRRIALITLTDKGSDVGLTLPDPIETKLISELADLEPEHTRILALVMNQILGLVDAQNASTDLLGTNIPPGTDQIN